MAGQGEHAGAEQGSARAAARSPTRASSSIAFHIVITGGSTRWEAEARTLNSMQAPLRLVALCWTHTQGIRSLQ